MHWVEELVLIKTYWDTFLLLRQCLRCPNALSQCVCLYPEVDACPKNTPKVGAREFGHRQLWRRLAVKWCCLILSGRVATSKFTGRSPPFFSHTGINALELGRRSFCYSFLGALVISLPARTLPSILLSLPNANVTTDSCLTVISSRDKGRLSVRTE